MRFKAFHFALIGRAHRAPRAVHHRADALPGLLAELGEFAESRLENPLERARGIAGVDRALKKLIQLAAAPEIALELLGLSHRALVDEDFDENVVPRDD